MPVAHIAIFLSVFGVVYGFLNIVPTLVEAYQKRFQSKDQETARELDKFFINFKPKHMYITFGVLAVLIGILSESIPLALLIAGIGYVSPKITLSLWKDYRSARFDAQFMDTLLLLENSLKSGLDIVAGIERIATSMKPPISEEFGLVLNAYRLGAPLETALLDLTKRISSRNLETVVYAIIIQRETGGNVIRTFDQLVASIRDESKLQKKVLALTSQGRTQIIFLASFPWVLAAIFYFISPDFMQPALAHPWGKFVLALLILWEAIGVVVTKKIVAVEV